MASQVDGFVFGLPNRPVPLASEPDDKETVIVIVPPVSEDDDGVRIYDSVGKGHTPEVFQI